MFHYAIKFNNKGQFILIAFHYASERDTFAKYAGFQPISGQQVNKRIRRDIVRKCNCYIRTAFNQNGVRVGTKVTSLYKPLNQQRIDRPEDSPIPCAPKAKRKNIVNATTAHQYKTKL